MGALIIERRSVVPKKLAIALFVRPFLATEAVPRVYGTQCGVTSGDFASAGSQWLCC